MTTVRQARDLGAAPVPGRHIRAAIHVVVEVVSRRAAVELP